GPGCAGLTRSSAIEHLSAPGGFLNPQGEMAGTTCEIPVLLPARASPRVEVTCMEASDKSLQIPPNTLGENRHICAFFNGMDEHYRVLNSFIKEGFEQGDKAFHLVDPERREDHLRRLADTGIDGGEAMGGGAAGGHAW